MNSSPPRLAHWTIIGLFLLMAVVVPALAAVVFPERLGQVRWLVVFSMLLYEAGVVRLVLLAFPDYAGRYRDYVRRQFATLNLRAVTPQGALTLDLERLYVPLYVDAKAVNQSPRTLFKLAPSPLRQGDHSVWEFLAARGLTGQSFMLVGEAGSGKTTLLQYMAKALAARKPEVPAVCRGWLPVLLFLREHASAICATPSLPLSQVISDHLARRQAPAPPAGWFDHQLAEGNCLVLLDGLNEIADPDLRQRIHVWIKNCLVAYPRNRFIITSRMREQRALPFPDVLTLELRPFGRAQMGESGAALAGGASAGAALATVPDVLAALAKGPLMALAGNPLLLTLLTNLRQQRHTLPMRSVEIYAAMLALAPEKRKMPAAQRQRLLQRLAYSMLCNRQLEIAPAEAAQVMAPLLRALAVKDPAEVVLQMLAGATGVLIKAETGYYRFAHLTFQEYLGAAHVAENQLQAELMARVNEVWWHETIRFYGAQAEAAAVVASLLSDNKVSVAGLVLALDCLDETHEARPAIWADCQAVWRAVLDDEEAERRKWVAEALLASRLRRLASQGGDRASDESLISCAEYQLFLDEQRSEGQFFQPDHWLGYRYAAGQGLQPVMGVRAADAVAFCEWLTKRQPGAWVYRLPTVQEARDRVCLTEAAPGRGYWTAASMGERGGREHNLFDLAWVDTARPLLVSETAVVEGAAADLIRDWRHLTPTDLPRDVDCDQLLAEVLVLSRELDRDLGLAQDPDHDLAATRALAHDLAGALGFDLAHALAFEVELARDRERALGYGLAQAGEPDVELDAKSLEALTQARVQAGRCPSLRWHPCLAALDLANAQALTSALAAKLEHILEANGAQAGQLEGVLEHNLSLALDRNLDRDLALAVDSDRALANALALKLNRACHLSLARALSLARELGAMPEHAVDCETLDRITQFSHTQTVDDEQVEQNLAEARDLARRLDPNLTAALEQARVHWRDRERASRLAHQLATARELAWDRGRRRHRGLVRQVLLLNALQPSIASGDEESLAAADLERQQLSRQYAELYLDFVTLEERVAGHLPPFEGLCLVRARA